ncbi:hypothetical protein DY000_02014269 [Brassica cretica]|uniref:Uncharacterized protein n=1 Tax=Brassica cretica TaxID=69181 RepID=A0ABQ7D677_BRACR|nr:hypothetical protein DY000_02014269 [Brassica cretica]
MTIELDHRSILERNNRSILTSVYRSTAKRAESPFGRTADLKPKFSPFYKITPDEFYPNYISFAAMLDASLEHSIRKEARSSSTDNNTCVSLDSAQPPSTQTLVSSTDIRSPLSTDNTHIPVDQHPSSDIDRHSIPDIDRYRAARDGCAFDTCTR